jgi:hypothetical protein
MDMDIRTFFGANTAHLDDIELFFSVGSRGSNDANNKRREEILVSLYNLPDEYRTHPKWVLMSDKWRTFLSTLCTECYDDVRVVKKGGRKENHDFIILYLHNGAVVHSVKAEFKHNAASISRIPQYLSMAENKGYLATSYARFYYTHTLDKVCALRGGIPKPDIDTYMKCVYSDNYDKHEMFRTLYDLDNTDPSDVQSKLVDESIAAYLKENKHTLNMKMLTEDIRQRQTGKVFILWDLKAFHSDIIRDDEMEIVSTAGVKNGNVLVAVSKAGTLHNMLLRWKNHKGVLFPAWQISLSR